MTRKLAALTVLWLVAGAAGRAEAGLNLVLNGDFGTGTFDGWTLSGDTDDAFVTPFGPGFAAALTTSPSPPDFGFLTQNLTTTVGQTYLVSFDVTGDGATPNSLVASLGGTALTSLTDLGAGPSTFSGSFTATSATSLLSFQFRDDSGFLFLTNISVTPQAVPEPSTLVSGLAALIPLVWHLRRGRRGAALRGVLG